MPPLPQIIVTPDDIGTSGHLTTDPPIVLCPIRDKRDSCHLYLDEKQLRNEEPSPILYSPPPPIGSACCFITSKKTRFHGRISHVIERQRTRLIVQVAHVTGPGHFSLVVPYHYYYQGWRLSLMLAIASWVYSDREVEIPGKRVID